jgi:hypothetical protein
MVGVPVVRAVVLVRIDAVTHTVGLVVAVPLAVGRVRIVAVAVPVAVSVAGQGGRRIGCWRRRRGVRSRRAGSRAVSVAVGVAGALRRGIWRDGWALHDRRTLRGGRVCAGRRRVRAAATAGRGRLWLVRPGRRGVVAVAAKSDAGSDQADEDRERAECPGSKSVAVMRRQRARRYRCQTFSSSYKLPQCSPLLPFTSLPERAPYAQIGHQRQYNPVMPGSIGPTVQNASQRPNKTRAQRTTKPALRSCSPHRRRASVESAGDDCRHSMCHPFSHANGYICRRRKRRAAARRERLHPATRTRERHLAALDELESVPSLRLLPRSRTATRPTTSRLRGRRAYGRRLVRCRGDCGTRRAGRAS